MDITKISSEDIQKYSRKLLANHRDGVKNFEEAANAIVQTLDNDFKTPDDRPAFSLIRIFRTYQHEQLPSSLKLETSPRHQYLTLVASRGVEPEWNDRTLSRSRRVLPIDHNMSPMFQGVFSSLGFKWETYTNVEKSQAQAIASMQMIKYFYVEDASQSSLITDKANFVEPYGIQSVMAIGSQFLSGAGYVLIAFSPIHIEEAQAEIFSQMAPFVSTLLAIFDGRKEYWL